MRSLHPWPIFPTHLEPQAARGLGLQFLIQELIQAFDLLESMRGKIDEDFEAISLELEKFLLFSLENPLAQKGGSLDKLCFYFEILLQNSCVDEETNIPALLEEMRGLVLHLKSKISSFKKPGSPSRFEEFSLQLVHLIETSQNDLRQIIHSLFPFLLESQEDENILFLLIEQREKLNFYLGERGVENILSRLFPQGPCTLRSALYNGYARRGFLDFYSRNEMLIDALDWEDACSLSNQKR